MAKETATIEIINGVEGLAVYINQYRVCGPKPWGGGTIMKQWTIPLKVIYEAIPAPEATDED